MRLYGAHGQPLSLIGPAGASFSLRSPTPLDAPSQAYFNGICRPQRSGIDHSNGDCHPASQSERGTGQKHSYPHNDHSDKASVSSWSSYTMRQRKTGELFKEVIGSRYDYPESMEISLSSAAPSITRKQSVPPIDPSNDYIQGEVPNFYEQNARRVESSWILAIQNNVRTPLQGERSLAPSARSGMSVRDMLGRSSPTLAGPEPRSTESTDMPELLHSKED